MPYNRRLQLTAGTVGDCGHEGDAAAEAVSVIQMKRWRAARTVEQAVALMASLLCGCAGGWALVNPDLTQKNQGQVVEAVEMNDGRVIFFDPFDSAGSGPDTRARMIGETIQGPVAGVPRTISLQDVRKIQFGMSVDAKKASPYIVGGVIFVGLLVPLAYLIAMGNIHGL